MPSFENTCRRWLFTYVVRRRGGRRPPCLVSPSATSRATASSATVIAASRWTGLGADEAASDAELAQVAADAAGVPTRSQFCVELEGTAESVDGGLRDRSGEPGAKVFECRRQLERPQRMFEDIDRGPEVDPVLREEPADMSAVAAIERMPGFSSDRRALFESASCASSSSCVAARCGRASLRRRRRMGSGAGSSAHPVRSVRRSQPRAASGVASAIAKKREQQRAWRRTAGVALLEHDMRDVAETTGLTGVAGVDRESPERDDAGSGRAPPPPAFRPRRKRPSSSAAASKTRPVFAQQARVQVSTSVGPSLMVALGGSEAVGGYCHRLVVPVGDAQEARRATCARAASAGRSPAKCRRDMPR